RADVDGAVPGQVLPLHLRGDEEAGGRQPVLQVRQPGPDAVQLLPLPRRDGGHLLRRPDDPRLRAQVDPVRRRVRVRGRRVHRRRVRELPDAAHGPRPRRLRRRHLHPGGPALHLRGGAGAAARDAQHPVPAHDHGGHPDGEHDQLPGVQGLGRLGLAHPRDVRRHPGRRHRAGRARHPGHPGVARRARGHGHGAQDAVPDPGRRRRARGVRRPGRRERGRQGRAVPLAGALLRRQVQAPAHVRAAHPLLPAAHRHQRHHVLRAGALQDSRLQAERHPRVLRHHRPRQRLLHLRRHRHRRQDRTPRALPAGRHADDHLP
ncbi:hypothetical protein ACJX0J_022804, partial [Zea mays]